ncbi:MAG: GUN4 domain-containing protein [Cyanobacteria bacterium P01_E01_bin.42]
MQTTEVIALPQYQKLSELLARGEWLQSDRETGDRILAILEKENPSEITSAEIEKIPCQDLQAIDLLWVTYSRGSFGFSRQKRIYENLGGTEKCDRETWDRFGDRMGWRVGDRWLEHQELAINLATKAGQFPSFPTFYLSEIEPEKRAAQLRHNWLALFVRLENCQVDNLAAFPTHSTRKFGIIPKLIDPAQFQSEIRNEWSKRGN